MKHMSNHSLNDVSYLKELEEVLKVTLDDMLTFDNT